MKNFVQPGKTITLIAPYDVVSGAGALVGSIFGVAAGTYSLSAEGEFVTEGVFELAKVSAQAWTAGVRIYWDNTAKLCTTTVGSNTLIGAAVAAATNPSATGLVRLNGSF